MRTLASYPLIGAVALGLLLQSTLSHGKVVPPLEGSNLTSTASPPVWGDWSSWSACSRECGGGVRFQQRECLSGCVQEETSTVEKRYQSCCLQSCPSETPDFKVQQCQELQIHGVNWTLSSQDNQDCSLLCEGALPNSTQLIRTLTYVSLGTSCRTSQGDSGVCLGTQCVVVGCDGVMGSKKTENKCLQCKSEDEEDGERCTHYSRTISPITGSTSILRLPQGSFSVQLSHPLNAEGGRLAMRALDDTTVFEGTAGNGTTFEAAGVSFLYLIRESAGGDYSEVLTTRGPLSQPLVVELRNVAMDTMTEVTYTYHTLQSSDSSVESPSNDPLPHSHLANEVKHDTGSEFEWSHMSPTECTVSCGRGTRTYNVKCVDKHFPDREIVDYFCISEGLEKPLPIVEPCCLGECQPFWVEGEWSPCSQQCEQRRLIECRQFQEEGRPPAILTNTSACPMETRPSQVRSCNLQECSATWVPGEWSQCSDIVGGLQHRTVECEDRVTGEPVDSTHCQHSPRPPTTQTCQLANCQDGKCCHWVPRKWKKCSNNCGYGTQTRNVFCQIVTSNHKTNETCCRGLEMPESSRDCWDNRGRCTTFWYEHEFGECLGDCCGEQHQERRVECVTIDTTAESNNQLLVMPDEACNISTRPPTRRVCQRQDCPEWVEHPWGACSAKCDRWGLQTRKVECVGSEGGVVAGEECCTPQPHGARSCYGPPCPVTSCTDTGPFCLGIAADLCDRDYFRQLCCATCSALSS